MGIDTSDATWSGSTNPLDAKYAKLNTDLSLLSRGDPMYARICAYIQNTCPGATVDGSVRYVDLDSWSQPVLLDYRFKAKLCDLLGAESRGARKVDGVGKGG